MNGLLIVVVSFFFVQIRNTCSILLREKAEMPWVLANGTLPDIPSLCPYNRFCQSPQASKNIVDEHSIPCCEKCSCDVKCYEIGNCCPDIPFSPAGKEKYPCVNIATDREFEIWYHVIDDCKDAFTSLVYQSCYQPADLNDLVVVSNPENGRVYKNEQCAICNDVRNYITWNLHVGCYDILELSFQTIEERDSYIFQNRYNCSVYSIPPDSKAGEMSRCVPDSDVVSKCNETRFWDYYDRNIEQACHDKGDEYNVIFRDSAPIVQALEKYANIYCYLCNQPKSTKLNDLCQAETYDTSSKLHFRTFRALLDTSAIDDNQEDYQCETKEFWDPFNKACRPLTCPAGTVPNRGLCKGIVQHSDGFIVRVHFEVMVENEMKKAITYNTLLRFLVRRIISMIGSGCGNSESTLHRLLNSTTLLLQMNLYSTKQCAVETMLANTRNIAQKKAIHLNYKSQADGKFHVAMRLAFSNYSGEKMEFLASMESESTILGPFKTVDSSILNYCPRVELTNSEALTLGLDTNFNLSKAHVDQENNGNTDGNFVCVETYQQAREAFSMSVSSSQHYFNINAYFVYSLIRYVMSKMGHV